ncbi:MAG TPA: DMT family transporter [Anaerolineales bacterium]|nr:DMT family transporter [Anaerolineales bacterium]
MTTATSQGSALPGRDVLLPFAAFIILVGGAPVAMRISYSELAPFWTGLTRIGLGAVIFWVLAVYKRLQLPKGRALAGAVLYGILGVGVTFVLMSWGLVKTPASMASMLAAMVPLVTVLLVAFQGVESLTARGVIGSLLAVAGIVISVGGASSTDISLPHVGAIILGTIFLAQSGVVIKQFPPNPPIMTNAIGMTVGAIILAFASLVAGETWALPSQASTWVAISYLVIFVSVLAFLFYLQVLNKWSASGTSYGFVIIPLVTVIIASILTREQITLSFLIGAVLVLIGVSVGALLPGRKNEAEIELCKDCAGQVVSKCI